MPDASLKDKLQPALLDRLSDDERFVTVFRVTPRRAALAEIGACAADVHRVLVVHGLRPVGATARLDEGDMGNETLEYSAPGHTVSPTQLRALAVPGSSGAVSLGGCCELEASTAANDQPEALERRAISMRRLREAVLRDLGWLLNCSNLEEVVDLSRYPEVRRSVLNYGLPSLAGRDLAAVDTAELGRRIADTLTCFEPRLSAVRVTADRGERSNGEPELSFRVEAELWGQPVAQHLSLRTSINLMSGEVSVTDQAARA